MADSTTTTGGDNDQQPQQQQKVLFFKKRSNTKNVRKRNLSDDEQDSPQSSTPETSTLSSISKKRSLMAKPPQTTHSDLLQGSSKKILADISSTTEISVAYKADTTQGNRRIDDATRTQEIDTDHDRDAQSIIERHLSAVENGLDESGTSSGGKDVYKGMSAYKSHIQKGEVTNSKMRVGPMRASSNIRVTNRFDYQPDICKDYKETGFCGYGDSCIYMHDRGDYKAGWQLDKEWEDEQRAKKLALIQGLDDEEDEEDSDEDGDIPFACLICREEFKHPIVTKCGHYFCEKCALLRYKKTPKCAACQTPTGGLFNPVSKDFMTKVAARKLKIEEAKRRRAEDDAAAGGGALGGIAVDQDDDTGLIKEDLSVVGMGGVPVLLPRRAGDDSESDDDDDSD